MASLEKRLEVLEGRRGGPEEEHNLTPAALRLLSFEDLVTLRGVVQEFLQRGTRSATFEGLAATSERSRRAIEALVSALEAVREGSA